MSTTPVMPSLSPDPAFDYYFIACRKGDATAKAITVGESAVRVLADASDITGLPRDVFEMQRELMVRPPSHYRCLPIMGQQRCM